MTRLESIIYDAIRAAIEIGGSKGAAAEWLGVAPKTIYNYMNKWPSLRSYLPEKSKRSVVSRAKSPVKGMTKTEREEFEASKKPISWVPDWYKEKYPSLFNGEE